MGAEAVAGDKEEREPIEDIIPEAGKLGCEEGARILGADEECLAAF